MVDKSDSRPSTARRPPARRVQAIPVAADDQGMGRIFALVAIGVCVYWLIDTIHASNAGVTVEGREVRLETADFDVRFSRLGSFSEAYMVFGGNNEQPRNSLSHATLAALAMRHAELIHQTYPDFHRCNSPGAAQAKRWIETLNLVATTRAVERVLVDAVDVHAERVREGGERTCVSLAGAPLSLESVRMKRDGHDLTQDVGRAIRGADFYLAERAELVDCKTLLR
jgi:hypothetical protein